MTEFRIFFFWCYSLYGRNIIIYFHTIGMRLLINILANDVLHAYACEKRNTYKKKVWRKLRVSIHKE